MADTIKLKRALEGHTHVLAFSYTGKSGRLDAIWKIIRGRHTILIAEAPLKTIPAQEVRDLADQVVSQSSDMRDAISRHKVEIRRYQAAIDALNAKLPEADRLQKIDLPDTRSTFQIGLGVKAASGGSGGTSSEAVSDWLGRNPPPLPEPPIGYAWPKVEPLEALEKRVAALEAINKEPSQ